MNPPYSADAEVASKSQEILPATTSASSAIYWTIRRELWENRSVYIAPLIVAGVTLIGFLISTIVQVEKMRRMAVIEPDKQRLALATHYSMSASMIMLTGFIVGAFYCIDALYGERRDRSILFWKSLPVSDRMAVLCKASIPIIVQPLLVLSIAIATRIVMAVLTAPLLLAYGVSPLVLWGRSSFLQTPLVMSYGIAVHALWFAPLYAWLLLVSAWARRAPLLWAALPFVAVLALERMALGTSQFAALLKYRLMGAMAEGFGRFLDKVPVRRLSELTPLRFFTSPGLWLGLIFAAVCLIAAMRLRRNREPM